jgi:hypothetical protein
MVSSVDLFGMIAAMVTNNAVYSGGGPQWKHDNPQLSAREDMINFLESNSNTNQERILSSTDSNFNGQAYILHTTNEFYPDAHDTSYNFYTENYHVVGLRTGNVSAGGTPLKLVYYYDWPSGQYQFDTSSAPSGGGDIVSEYYNLSSDPGELTNNYASISSGADATFRGVIGSEMQATLPTVNGINLATVLATAQANWATYLTAPSSITVTPSTLTHNPPSEQSISVHATTPSSILPSATVIVSGGGIADQYLYVLDNAGAPPYSGSFLFPAAGSYTIKLKNPNGLSSSLNYTVT